LHFSQPIHRLNYQYSATPHDNISSFYQNNRPSNSNNYYQRNLSSLELGDRNAEEEKDILSKFTKDIKDMHQTMREIVEIKNMSKQLQPPSSSLGQLAGSVDFTIPVLNAIKTAANPANYNYASQL
jgi:hypothetical protein